MEYDLTEKDYIVEHYRSGQIVIQQGDPADYVRIIVSGAVDVPVHASNGKSCLIRYSLANCILGNVELFTNDPSYINGAVAVTELKVIAIPMQKARKLLQTSNNFCRRMAEELAGKMRRTTQDILAAQTRTAEERLCFYLIEQAEEDCYSATLTQAANATGITYRHTMRIIKKLCDERLILRTEKGYQIINKEELWKRTMKNG